MQLRLALRINELQQLIFECAIAKRYESITLDDFAKSIRQLRVELLRVTTPHRSAIVSDIIQKLS